MRVSKVSNLRFDVARAIMAAELMKILTRFRITNIGRGIDAHFFDSLAHTNTISCGWNWYHQVSYLSR